jgi:hypothetical protein
MISYIQFINYLKKNNIIMFDHDYRISYNRLNNEKFINKYINNQTGGGSQNELKNIVNLSVSSNPHYVFLYL